jgi:Putative addiction module component
MLLIQKKKLVYCEVNIEPIPKKLAKDITNKRGLVNCLNERVRIAPKVLFVDLFNHLLREEEWLNILFYSYLRGHKLSDYLEDMNKKVLNGNKDEEALLYVQCTWHAEHDDSSKEIDIYPNFSGVAKPINNKDKGIIAIGLTSLSAYKNLPLLLKEPFEILFYDKKQKKMKCAYQSKRSFRVYDLLDSIIEEISFYGLPTRRDEFCQELDRRMEEVRSGKANLISWKEVRKKLKSKGKIKSKAKTSSNKK